jgi:putative polyhydroxyalkanoate system protein
MQTKSITVSIPHHLTQAQARERLQKGITSTTTNFSKMAQVKETWNGNHLDLNIVAMGQSIDGKIDVEPSVVKVEVNLPWFLAAMAEKIKPQIEQEGRKMLEQQ